MYLVTTINQSVAEPGFDFGREAWTLPTWGESLKVLKVEVKVIFKRALAVFILNHAYISWRAKRAKKH